MWFILYRLIRPALPLSSGLAAWIISRACGAEANSCIAVAVSIALSTIGASLYHFGGANWMYARKSDRLQFKYPRVLKLLGLIIFSISIAIALWWLPIQCAMICLFNALIIVAYSAKLSAHWATKNITMSIVSATPIVIGWQAGLETHAIVPWAIGIAGITHFSREMIKDVKDIIANEGKRVTLPMVLGTENTLQISGALLLVATILPFCILQFTASTLQAALICLSAALLFATSLMLIISKKAGRCETLIHASIFLMLLAVV